MVYEVHKEVGVSFEVTKWKWFSRVDWRCDWNSSYVCGNVPYVFDYAALHLKSAEAFIVALSAMSGRSIASFDEKAVRDVIRRVNEIWEFVP